MSQRKYLFTPTKFGLFTILVLEHFFPSFYAIIIITLFASPFTLSLDREQLLYHDPTFRQSSFILFLIRAFALHG